MPCAYPCNNRKRYALYCICGHARASSRTTMRTHLQHSTLSSQPNPRGCSCQIHEKKCIDSRRQLAPTLALIGRGPTSGRLPLPGNNRAASTSRWTIYDPTVLDRFTGKSNRWSRRTAGMLGLTEYRARRLVRYRIRLKGGGAR